MGFVDFPHDAMEDPSMKNVGEDFHQKKSSNDKQQIFQSKLKLGRLNKSDWLGKPSHQFSLGAPYLNLCQIS